MATLEDKILGDKLHNYCSSSESGGDSGESDSEEGASKQPTEGPAELPEPNKWEGQSTNTGPKGVIKDWQRFKQLETERRAAQEQERLLLMKKLSLTCRSALDDEKAKAEEDSELSELLDDDFLLAYQKQRMQDMLLQAQNLPRFGSLISLKSGEEFLQAIDKEDKATVIVHIFEEDLEACHVMNCCLSELSQKYQHVKFCCIVASKTGLSKKFKSSGIPAILVYKKGELIGNFIRVSDELGNDFEPDDVKEFLVEHGILTDRSFVPQIVRSTEADSDSD